MLRIKNVTLRMDNANVERTLEGDSVTCVYLVITIYPVGQGVVTVLVTLQARPAMSATSQQVSVNVCQELQG